MPDSSFLLARIFPGHKFNAIDPDLLKDAKTHLDSLTKPAGSLGELEVCAMRLYAIENGRMPLRVDPAMLYTVAGDHGVARQKVSPFPQAVTRQMVENFLDGGAAINALCRSCRINLRVVDAGCADEPFSPHAMLIDRRLGAGCGDISLGPAMSEEKCIEGLQAGFSLAASAAQNGFACICAGEMGIANSTSATALYCAFLNLKPEDITGPGAGADEKMVRHKIEIIKNALAINADALQSGSPLAILAALGGFEITLLCGLMLGCASQRLPLVVDGFICFSAYVAGLAFHPHLADYAFLSHVSAEPGFKIILNAMKLPQKPLLDLGLRLGEGTGAALALTILRAAASIYNEMASLKSAGVEASPEDRIEL